MAVSDKPGTCQDQNCPDYGKPLEECDCEDAKHFGKQEKKDVREDGQTDQAQE